MKLGQLVMNPADRHFCDPDRTESCFVLKGTPMVLVAKDCIEPELPIPSDIKCGDERHLYLIGGKLMVFTPFPLLNLNIQSVPVNASTYRLKARWSVELARDLRAYHQI